MHSWKLLFELCRMPSSFVNNINWKKLFYWVNVNFDTNFACSTLGSSTLWYFILLFSCWRCCRTALSFHGLSLVGFLTGGISVRPMSKGSCTSPDDKTNIISQCLWLLPFDLLFLSPFYIGVIQTNRKDRRRCCSSQKEARLVCREWKKHKILFGNTFPSFCTNIDHIV